MSFEEKSTHYEVLELQPDASPNEVRAAYQRAKAAYTRDSVALYTLVSPEEREAILRRVEEAFSVLSNPNIRKEYDKCHGLLGADAPLNVVSIDRVPPMTMDSGSAPETLLVAPATDFSNETPIPPPASTAAAEASRDAGTPTSGSLMLEDQLRQEVIWPGSLLKRIRETKGISVEEMASITKISKSNITAIEEENFKKFPAPVYLRGFVVQISKTLKLPHDKVASAYIARYYQSQPEAKA